MSTKYPKQIKFVLYKHKFNDKIIATSKKLNNKVKITRTQLEKVMHKYLYLVNEQKEFEEKYKKVLLQ